MVVNSKEVELHRTLTINVPAVIALTILTSFIIMYGFSDAQFISTSNNNDDE